MRSSRSPRFTHCPSSTASWITRPDTSAEMSTLRLGWIFPLAVTVDTRSRRATASVRTSRPAPEPLLAMASAARTPTTSTTPRAISSFFILLTVPLFRRRRQRSGRPTRASSAASDLW
jgi:hypothetical protein